jgi:hypothetical protein
MPCNSDTPPNTVKALEQFFMSLRLDGTVCFDNLSQLWSITLRLKKIYILWVNSNGFSQRFQSQNSRKNKSNNALLISLWPHFWAQHATMPTESHSGPRQTKLIMQPRSSELDRLPALVHSRSAAYKCTGFVCRVVKWLPWSASRQISGKRAIRMLQHGHTEFYTLPESLDFDRKLFQLDVLQILWQIRSLKQDYPACMFRHLILLRLFCAIPWQRFSNIGCLCQPVCLSTVWFGLETRGAND